MNKSEYRSILAAVKMTIATTTKQLNNLLEFVDTKLKELDKKNKQNG